MNPPRWKFDQISKEMSHQRHPQDNLPLSELTQMKLCRSGSREMRVQNRRLTLRPGIYFRHMQFQRKSVALSVDILLTSWIWQLRRFFANKLHVMIFIPYALHRLRTCLVNLKGILFITTFHSWRKILCWSDSASFQALITLLHRSWAKQPKKVLSPRTQDKQFFVKKHSFFMTIMMMSQAITLTKGKKNGNIV